MALEYDEAFQNLTDKEKMYTYYLFKAIAAGWRVFLVVSLLIQQITAIQTSKESPYIISLLLRVFKHESADGLKERLMKEGFVLFILSFYVQKDEKCIDSFILYCYNVFGNMGNYRYCHKVVMILEDLEIQKYFLAAVRVISKTLSVIPQPIRMNRKRLKNCGRIVAIKCFLTNLLNFVQVLVIVVFPLITVIT